MRRLMPLALIAAAFLLVLVVARSGGLGAGIEMLQLALLGVVLLLVCARLRVLAKRRWAQAPADPRADLAGSARRG